MGIALSLYASGKTLYGVTAEVHDRSVTILEHHKLENAPYFLAPDPFHLEPLAVEGEGHEENLQHSGGGIHPTPEELSQLTEFLSRFKNKWVRAALIVPPQDFLSVNLELPFSDAKSIQQVLDLEVQDRVPFPTKDFLLQPTTIGVKGADLFEIHVSVIPRLIVQHSLSVSHAVGLEPAILTTPSSVLSALPFLSPTYFAENAAFLLVDGKHVYLSINIDGETKTIFSPPPQSANGTPELEKQILESSFQALRLFLVSSEEKYGKRIEKIYFIGQTRQRELAQQVLGRQCEGISCADFFANTPEEFMAAALGSVFASDVQPPPILVNFRHGEFRYSPQLEGLLLGLKQLIRPGLAFFLCLLLSLGAIYWSRAERLSTIQRKLKNQVERVVGPISAPPGQELQFVRSSVGQIQSQLEEVSSTAPQSSIAILLEISRILRLFPKIEVETVRVVSTSVLVKGKADSFNSVDNLRDEFKKSDSLFCDVVDRSKTFGNEVNVDFSLTPCGA
ncbi:MAG: hypothetical protein KDD64_12670 [Bdellovibrionales bacterium]|nr:hypothetical protein [Bdellovibrionales bacterium]